MFLPKWKVLNKMRARDETKKVVKLPQVYSYSCGRLLWNLSTSAKLWSMKISHGVSVSRQPRDIMGNVVESSNPCHNRKHLSTGIPAGCIPVRRRLNITKVHQHYQGWRSLAQLLLFLQLSLSDAVLFAQRNHSRKAMAFQAVQVCMLPGTHSVFLAAQLRSQVWARHSEWKLCLLCLVTKRCHQRL